MTYDGFTLAAVIAELNRTLLRGRVQKVRQHNDTDLTLEVRAVGHTYLLFLSVNARFPRVYLTATSNPVPQPPPHFRMVLRKYVEGAFIAGIHQVAMDRIMRIRLDSSEHGQLELVMEIMGKHSNLILVDGSAKILGAIKHVGPSISRYRQVLPGREYVAPPAQEKIDPRALDGAAFDRLWLTRLPDRADVDVVRDWLINTLSGFGPFLADEIVARTREDGAAVREKAREEVLALGEMARTGSFMPVFVTDESGEGLMVYPMPSVQFPAAQQHARPSVNEALDTLFRTLVSKTALEDERAQTLTAIQRAQAARKQTLKSIERTLSESERAERYRQIGEMLISNLQALEKGAKSARLVDYFDPEMPEIDVELDEKLSPQQNAERYFRRYQKARDAASTAQTRKRQVARESDVLEAAAREAESARSVESLRELRGMLASQGLLREAAAPQKAAEEQFGGQRIRRIITSDGWEILYGENSRANDYLTQRVAGANDVWLHARSITGAHVVIRTAGRSGGVPRNVLHQAAKIAAQNSEAKHSSLVPVDHTLRKYVRKPRGSAPGFVTYRNEKTLDVNPRA